MAEIFSVWAKCAGWEKRGSVRGVTTQTSHLALLELWVLIPPVAWMLVCCECCVLSDRDLCHELITRPGESYRLCRVSECDLETSWMRTRCGCWHINKKKSSILNLTTLMIYVYSYCKIRINRLSGCHTLPNGVIALQSILSTVRVRKILRVYSDSSKKLNNPKQLPMHSFVLIRPICYQG